MGEKYFVAEMLLPLGGNKTLSAFRKGEMGTGARGAPIPVVGLYMKIKRAQCRKPGSRPNEGHVNSR
jgi:hypothetical protein